MLASHRIIKIVLACLLAAYPLWANAYALAQDEEVRSVTAKPLPPLQYKDENGAVQAVDAKGAKLTLIHFWATWCVPCVEELPQVDGLSDKYGARGLKIIALSVDTNIDKVKSFYTDHHIAHLPAYLDNNNMSFLALSLQGLPTTIFVAANGTEIARAEGPVNWSDPAVTKYIEDALK